VSSGRKDAVASDHELWTNPPYQLRSAHVVKSEVVSKELGELENVLVFDHAPLRLWGASKVANRPDDSTNGHFRPTPPSVRDWMRQ
jgi:hypothetical protein